MFEESSGEAPFLMIALTLSEKEAHRSRLLNFEPHDSPHMSGFQLFWNAEKGASIDQCSEVFSGPTSHNDMTAIFALYSQLSGTHVMPPA